MKVFYLIIIAFSLQAQTTIYGLEFDTTGQDPSSAFQAIQFANPDDNGLPIWGPNDAGVTYIWELYNLKQQDGYYTTFFWADENFLWDGGGSNTYYGFHPYPWPSPGVNTSTHDWEISGTDGGADFRLTRSGSALTVVKNTSYIQAAVVTVWGDGSKRVVFYIDLPDTTDGNVIENTALASWGETDPPNPFITFGDAPWFAAFQHERMAATLGRVKIITGALTGADLLAEAADMTQLVTQAAIDSIWWGITNFETVDDLTCDYGTARSFVWANGAQKADLVPVDTIAIIPISTKMTGGGNAQMPGGGSGSIKPK